MEQESADSSLELTRAKARELIERKPWRDRADWLAGVIVYNSESGAFISYVLIGVLFLPVSVLSFKAIRDHDLQLIWGALFFLVLASPLIYLRITARRAVSQCTLRSIPARIGGALDVIVRVRLPRTPLGGAIASLVTFDVGLVNNQKTRRLTKVCEQRIEAEKILVDAGGIWTIRVGIPIPAIAGEVDEWELIVALDGPQRQILGRYAVPIFNLADLSFEYETTAAAKEDARIAIPETRGRNISIGVLVGAATSIAIAGESPYVPIRHNPLAFAGLLAGFVAFYMVSTWRNAVARALFERDSPEKNKLAPMLLHFLRAAPWAVAAVVAAFAWQVIPIVGVAWGMGMVLAVQPSPFGSVWRDPMFQAGCALGICTLGLTFGWI